MKPVRYRPEQSTHTGVTPAQRREYADMLADGVPEDVIAEFDMRLNAYIDRHTRALLKQFALLDAKRGIKRPSLKTPAPPTPLPTRPPRHPRPPRPSPPKPR